MQVFVPFVAPIRVAECLDRRRLNKQVIECRQIIRAICGESSAWRNHPIVKMYSGHVMWLTLYAQCLEAYRRGDMRGAWKYSSLARKYIPPFLINGSQLTYWHRGRLCRKDPEHYEKYFAFLPPAFLPPARDAEEFVENVYIVDGKALWYRDGKLVKVGMFPEDFYGERTWVCEREAVGVC